MDTKRNHLVFLFFFNHTSKIINKLLENVVLLQGRVVYQSKCCCGKTLSLFIAHYWECENRRINAWLGNWTWNFLFVYYNLTKIVDLHFLALITILLLSLFNYLGHLKNVVFILFLYGVKRTSI